MPLYIKRIYDAPSANDGFRVLVDRVWPRGVSKEKAKLDLWLKEVAPSTELRQWFGHKPEKFSEFHKKYRAELDKNPATIELKQLTAKHKTTTLLYGAKDTKMNQAVVLKEYLH